MKKFEYKTVSEKNLKSLDSEGGDGWELCSVFFNMWGNTYFFKREKAEKTVLKTEEREDRYRDAIRFLFEQTNLADSYSGGPTNQWENLVRETLKKAHF